MNINRMQPDAEDLSAVTGEVSEKTKTSKGATAAWEDWLRGQKEIKMHRHVTRMKVKNKSVQMFEYLWGHQERGSRSHSKL